MSDLKQFAIVAILIAASLVALAQAEVKATALLFRHGQRTPIAVSGNINSTATEDLGEGQLTNVSKPILISFAIVAPHPSLSSITDRKPSTVRERRSAPPQISASVSPGWLLPPEQHADNDLRS